MARELAYNNPKRQHKHKGVVRVKNGTEYLRLHPVGVKHKDSKVVRFHNGELVSITIS